MDTEKDLERIKWLEDHIAQIEDNLANHPMSEVSIWCHNECLREDKNELDELKKKYSNADTK
jgi:hypothetical protein